MKLEFNRPTFGRVMALMLALSLSAHMTAMAAPAGTVIVRYPVAPSGAPIADTASDPNLTVSTIGFSGALTHYNPPFTPNIFEARDWRPSAVKDLTKYVQFTITPNAGQQLSFIAGDLLRATLQVDSGATCPYEIAYSTDGTTFATLQTGSLTSGAANNHYLAVSVPLNGIPAVAAGTTLTFRIYYWNTDAAGGGQFGGLAGSAYAGGQDVTVTGTVGATAAGASAPAPEEVVVAAAKKKPAGSNYLNQQLTRVRRFIIDVFE